MKDKILNTEKTANSDLGAVTYRFLSGKDKQEQFQKELKSLLAKYDAELQIENFGSEWSDDEKIVVNFAWDKDLSKKINDGTVPQWVIGRWENGR